MTHTTTVENCGNTAQTVTADFTFTQNTATTAEFQKKIGTSSSTSLGLKIPVINSDLGVTQGDSFSFADGETVNQAAQLESTYSIPLTVPAGKKQQITGTMKTTTATVKVPVRYNLIYTCNEVEEQDNMVSFTTTGLVTGTSSDVQLQYGKQTDC